MVVDNNCLFREYRLLREDNPINNVDNTVVCIDPLEKKLVRKLLEELREISASKETFSDLIDNFISI